MRKSFFLFVFCDDSMKTLLRCPLRYELILDTEQRRNQFGSIEKNLDEVAQTRCMAAHDRRLCKFGASTAKDSKSWFCTACTIRRGRWIYQRLHFGIGRLDGPRRTPRRVKGMAMDRCN